MRNTARTALKKPKIRMSMSKYNLYNLSRARSPTSQYRTQNFFKQKWSAKSLLRAYHGEQVRERHWQKMFSRKLNSVVPMNPEYLARNDGSIESAGRGSGLVKRDSQTPTRRTPYMLQTFAPLERRLDIAVYRALFASSARQARQFVVHGAVTVNGKPMRYPGYLLNPGDMFQVRPSSVMYALGAPKLAEEPTQEDATEAQELEAEDAEQKETTDDRTPKQILKDLMVQSKDILANAKDGLSAKRKQDLRALAKNVRSLMSKAGRTEVDTGDVEAQFEEIQRQLRLAKDSKEAGQSSLPSQQSSQQQPEGATATTSAAAESINTATTPTAITDVQEDTEFGRKDESLLRRALKQLSINPVDESKPYATPWTPRDYLSAFAFIPRYLEVNQNICAAVYLRHPVAKPGYSEVPSPFSEAANANAFAWYLRRR